MIHQVARFGEGVYIRKVDEDDRIARSLEQVKNIYNVQFSRTFFAN